MFPVTQIRRVTSVKLVTTRLPTGPSVQLQSAPSPTVCTVMTVLHALRVKVGIS